MGPLEIVPIFAKQPSGFSCLGVLVASNVDEALESEGKNENSRRDGKLPTHPRIKLGQSLKHKTIWGEIWWVVVENIRG